MAKITEKFLILIPIAVLLSPPGKIWLPIFLAAAILLNAVVHLKTGISFNCANLKPRKVITAACIVYFGAFCFRNHWQNRYAVLTLAGKLGISNSNLAWIFGGVIAVLAMPGIIYLVEIFDNLIEKIRLKGKFLALNTAALLICSALEYIQLNCPVMISYNTYYAASAKTFILNAGIALLVNLIILLIFRKWKLSVIISSAIFTIWGVANVYVCEFHGSPLFLSELANFGTAMEVVGGYDLFINTEIVLILFSGAFEICLATGMAEDTGIGIPAKICLRLGAAVLDAAILYVCLFGPNGVITNGDMSFSWTYSVGKDGFFIRTLADIQQINNPYKKLDGYDAGEIVYSEPEKPEENEYPDIILILNESFSDFSASTDIATDVDYLSDFYSVENAVYGFVPAGSGGGTNNSEFELLTSKSMYLLNSSAPFNYFNFKKSDSSLVTYLNSLGYDTVGMHCASATNYNRKEAYNDIGFGRVLLGRDSFSYYNKYGSRDWLDEDNYRDLIDNYNTLSDSPRFVYLLTYQNHGGYEQNPEELDTVHVTGDYGTLTGQLNEYLTSDMMSVEAFKYLTDYFKTQDRHVILCMVGDHTPSILNSVTGHDLYAGLEDTFMKMCVPYVMWSNYGADFSACTEYMSMITLAPMVVKAAGLPTSAFYQTIFDMHESLPVSLSNGMYMDEAGNIGEYNSDSEYYELITNYLMLEYNSFNTGDDYMRELFYPKN